MFTVIDFLDQCVRDLRIAARGCVQRPGFAITSIASLGLAIGTVTAVTPFVDAIVIRRLPLEGAGRLVNIRQQSHAFHVENSYFSSVFLDELRKRNSDFEDVLAVREIVLNVADHENTGRITGEIVSGNYFRMLGVRPVVGRLIDESDDAPGGAARVCVISYRLWQERFGGRDNAIGKDLTLNTSIFQVIGVTEASFMGSALHSAHDVEIPSSALPVFLGETREQFGWGHLLARLKPGISRKQAEDRLDALGHHIEELVGPRAARDDRFSLKDGTQGFVSRKEQLGKPVLVLFALVAAVLGLACINLAALLSVRAAEQSKEFCVRMAIGAGKRRVLQQLLLQSLLLAGIGGLCGWPIALVLIRTLLNLLGTQSGSLAAQIHPTARVFAVSAAITMMVGVSFGALAAIRIFRLDPLTVVRGGGFLGARRGKPAYRVLIAAQLAISVALIFAAGLFVQTLHNLRAINLGFRPENLILVHLDLARTAYGQNTAPQYFEELLRQTRLLDGTRDASFATISALSGKMSAIVLRVPGYVSHDRLPAVSFFATVTGGYFRTLNIPILAGRDFEPADRGTTDGVVIVNEQFARQFLGGDALGKTFAYGGGRKVRVIGMVPTARFQSLREDPHPVMYTPVTQWSFPQDLVLHVRTSQEPAGVSRRLQALIRNLDPKVPIDQITTMEDQISDALSTERLLAFLSAALGALALGISSLGLYGVISYSVVQRTREIGIRMAVGAQRRTVLRLFLQEGLLIAAGGFAAGSLLALVAGRMAGSLLYGLKAADPGTLLFAFAALGAVAFAAAAVPSLRASKVDPVAALRHE